VGSVATPVVADLNRDGAPDLVGVLGSGGSELETVLSACMP